MSLRLSAASILNDLKRGLLEPRLYATLVVALALWMAAYQHKRDYTVDVAGPLYHPYIEGFNDVERSDTDPPFDYRWSRSAPEVVFPGVGNQPAQVEIVTIGARPGGEPPAIEWSARGQAFQLQTQAQERSDTFFLERGSDALDGDLRLSFNVPAFTPPGDPRELGVIIRSVTVRPADYGLRPFVIPSACALLGLLAGLVGVYLLVVLSGVGSGLALVSSWALALLATLGIVLARLDTALLAASLPSLLAWALPAVVLARLALGRALAGVTTARGPGYAIAWGTLAFGLAFMLRFGGVTYPQFLTSDLLLHVHNVQEVAGGTWVFTEPLPDGRPVPYPPAYYLLIAAFTPLTGLSDEGLGLALKWSASMLDALSCLGLAWAACRLWPRHGQVVGAFAAFGYLASPGALDLFSAGNYTNIFAQSVLNLTLLGALVYVSGQRFGGRWALASLAAGFFLTVLGHYGMMLATLGIMGIFAISTLLLRKSPAQMRRAWGVLGAFGAALGAGLAVYYWRFLDLIGAQFGDVLGRLSGQSSSPSAPEGPGLPASLGRLTERVGQLVGGLLVVCAAFGSALLSRRVGAMPLLVGSWLAAAATFALLDRVVGDSIRWYYLAAAPAALLAGRFLGLLSTRRRWSLPLAALVISAALLQMLQFWLDLIYTRYH